MKVKTIILPNKNKCLHKKWPVQLLKKTVNQCLIWKVWNKHCQSTRNSSVEENNSRHKYMIMFYRKGAISTQYIEWRLFREIRLGWHQHLLPASGIIRMTCAGAAVWGAVRSPLLWHRYYIRTCHTCHSQWSHVGQLTLDSEGVSFYHGPREDIYLNFVLSRINSLASKGMILPGNYLCMFTY